VRRVPPTCSVATGALAALSVTGCATAYVERARSDAVMTPAHRRGFDMVPPPASVEPRPYGGLPAPPNGCPVKELSFELLRVS